MPTVTQVLFVLSIIFAYIHQYIFFALINSLHGLIIVLKVTVCQILLL